MIHQMWLSVVVVALRTFPKETLALWPQGSEGVHPPSQCIHPKEMMKTWEEFQALLLALLRVRVSALLWMAARMLRFEQHVEG